MTNLNAYITRNDQVRPQFPCLMEGKGFIVLFHAQDRGTVIASDGVMYEIGHYSKSWDTSVFKPFTGNVTIGDPSSVSSGKTGGAEFIDLSDVLLGRDLGNYGRDLGNFGGGRFGNAARAASGVGEQSANSSQVGGTQVPGAMENPDVQQAVQLLAEALTAAGIANIEGLHITAVRSNGAAA